MKVKLDSKVNIYIVYELRLNWKLEKKYTSTVGCPTSLLATILQGHPFALHSALYLFVSVTTLCTSNAFKMANCLKAILNQPCRGMSPSILYLDFPCQLQTLAHFQHGHRLQLLHHAHANRHHHVPCST